MRKTSRHKQTFSDEAATRRGRWGVAGVSTIVLLWGIGTLHAGKLLYSNLWGGAVFAPFAIIIGLLGLFVSVIKRKV